ncbi:hypothetical protein ICE98_00390 [Lactococcus lactis]|nr:hypothetical protein [Lactococcus lactis]
MRSFFTDLARLTIPRSYNQRKMTCAGLLPYLFPISSKISFLKMPFFPSANGAHASNCTFPRDKAF